VNKMKVFVLHVVLCDYTCGCIIVAARNAKEAAKIIVGKHGESLDGDSIDKIESNLEEITAGYYTEVYGGSGQKQGVNNG